MASKAEKTKSLKDKYVAGEQRSRHSMQEFGPGKREFIFCPHGEAVYYKKSWHHAEKFFKNPPNLSKKGVHFKLCPAHEMIKNKQYEGEILIENIPEKFKKEFLRLVENMGERAMRKDVLDRVLEVRSKNQEIRITTSENQLAQRIGRKIGEVFRKKMSVKAFRQEGGDVIRVRVDFV